MVCLQRRTLSCPCIRLRLTVQTNVYAERLARRLDGLPLALTTAGPYLQQVNDFSFKDYLKWYKQECQEVGRFNEKLGEYEGRKLFTT